MPVRHKRPHFAYVFPIFIQTPLLIDFEAGAFKNVERGKIELRHTQSLFEKHGRNMSAHKVFVLQVLYNYFFRLRCKSLCLYYITLMAGERTIRTSVGAQAAYKARVEKHVLFRQSCLWSRSVAPGPRGMKNDKRHLGTGWRELCLPLVHSQNRPDFMFLEWTWYLNG